MTTSSAPKPSDGGHRVALSDIPSEFPCWHVWEGAVAGLLYARRRRSSPPVVVRSTTTEGLCLAIEAAERERGLRP